MDDDKIKIAKKAVGLLKQGDVAAFGASSTMPFIIDCLLAEINNGLNIRLLTSSFITQQLLRDKGLQVDPLSNYDSINIYFDGCDQFDRDLNAVKSGGGIHTREKLLASMANQFVLLGDQTKYVDQFNIQFPLVLEVLPEACHYVQKVIQLQFTGAKIVVRLSDRKIGAAVTDNGNYLIDIFFTGWPEPRLIHNSVKQITGVVDTSLFYQLAHTALLPVGDDVITLTKRRG